MDYVVENEFTYKGMKCVVVMRPMAHRCGYVGVEEGHPLYGKHYNSYLDIKKEDVMDREISGIIPLICAALDSTVDTLEITTITQKQKNCFPVILKSSEG